MIYTEHNSSKDPLDHCTHIGKQIILRYFTVSGVPNRPSPVTSQTNVVKVSKNNFFSMSGNIQCMSMPIFKTLPYTTRKFKGGGITF